jgi:hypothetical protein
MNTIDKEEGRMRRKSFVCLIALGFAFGLAMSGPAIAGDENCVTAPVPALPFAAMAPNGDTYITDTDNENNAHTGAPDGDMGGASPPCLFNDDTIHPIEFNIFLTGPLPTTSAQLFIEAYDVDETSGEDDQVYVNGTLVGTLTGADSTWSTTVLNVPLAVVQAGANLIEIQVDIHNVHTWCVSVARGQLVIDGGAAASASCRFVTTDKAQYDFAEAVSTTLEVDTSLTSQTVRVEVNLLDPAAVIQDGLDRTFTVTGAIDDPQVFNLSIPGSGTSGTWKVEALIFDDSTRLFQSSCFAQVQVGVPQEPIPTTSRTGLLILIGLIALAGMLAIWRFRT